MSVAVVPMRTNRNRLDQTGYPGRTEQESSAGDWKQAVAKTIVVPHFSRHMDMREYRLQKETVVLYTFYDINCAFVGYNNN